TVPAPTSRRPARPRSRESDSIASSVASPSLPIVISNASTPPRMSAAAIGKTSPGARRRPIAMTPVRAIASGIGGREWATASMIGPPEDGLEAGAERVGSTLHGANQDAARDVPLERDGHQDDRHDHDHDQHR